MSIEKKLTYLKDTKALIRKKLNRFGINVSSENTFRSYVDFLDEILNRYPKSRGQGTSITLENTIKAQFTKFDVEGNSTQESTTGKSLLPNNATTQTYFGITITKKDDGTLILNGTATDNIQLNLLNNKRNNTMLPEADIKYSLKSGIYKLSGCTNGSSSTYKLDVWVDGAEGLKATCFNQEVQFTLDEEKNVSYLRLVVYREATLNNVVIKPMVRLASITDDTYEPYTGGIASPNPNYEQPIYSAGDNENIFDIQTIVKGRLDNGEIGYADNVENLTLNKDSFSFTTNANYRGVTSDFIKISKDFIVSYDNLNTEFVATAACYDKNKVWLGNATITGVDNQKYRQYAIVNNTAYVRVYFYLVTAGTITVKKPKLEKGNKASGYSPYGMGSINEKIQTRNFIGLNNLEQGTFNGNGEKTNDVLDLRVRTKNKIFLLSGKYTINVTNMQIVVYRFDFNNILYEADRSQQWKSAPYTFTMTSNGYVNIAFKNLNETNITPTDVIMALAQLEPGSTESPYVEHKEQDYSIFVQQPFRSIGDVRDCFVKKSDGKLYERHYFGKVEQLLDLVGPVEQGFYFIPQGIKKEAKLLSTHQQLGTKTASEEWQRFDGSQMKQLYPQAHNGVYINYKADTKQEQINWWNSLNNILLYELAEPLDLPCTEEQIQQLENKPSTYKDFTIINSQDETEAYLEVAGLKED